MLQSLNFENIREVKSMDVINAEARKRSSVDLCAKVDGKRVKLQNNDVISTNGLIDKQKEKYLLYVQNALRSALAVELPTAYGKVIETTEITASKVAAFRKESQELDRRLGRVEKSTATIKSLIKSSLERSKLPAPTEGKKPPRQVSSQAPRVIPVPTSNANLPRDTSGIGHDCHTTAPPTIPIASISSSTDANSQTLSRVSEAIPQRPNAMPSNLNQTIVVDGIMLASTPQQNQHKIHKLLPPQQPLIHPPLQKSKVVPVRSDTSEIDLTVEKQNAINKTQPHLPDNTNLQALPAERNGCINRGRGRGRGATNNTRPRPPMNNIYHPSLTSQAQQQSNLLPHQQLLPNSVGYNHTIGNGQYQQPEHLQSFNQMHQQSTIQQRSTQPRMPVAPLPLRPMFVHIPMVHGIQPPLFVEIAPSDEEGVCVKFSLQMTNHLYEAATCYELYSYQESEYNRCSMTSPWKKVGDISALPLPMAVTLTQVQPDNIYYFAVRSVDRYGRYSEWSNVACALISEASDNNERR